MNKKRNHPAQGPASGHPARPEPAAVPERDISAAQDEQPEEEKRPAVRKADKPAADKPAPKKKSFLAGMQKLGRNTAKWGRELKSEIKKIIWPTRKQVVNNTGVVLVVIAIVGVAIWLIDLVFENIILKGLLMLVTGF